MVTLFILASGIHFTCVELLIIRISHVAIVDILNVLFIQLSERPYFRTRPAGSEDGGSARGDGETHAPPAPTILSFIGSVLVPVSSENQGHSISKLKESIIIIAGWRKR